jgi:MFS family permease
VLLPVYLEQRFRAAEAFGLLVACAGLAAVGGALLTGLVRPVRRGRWAYSGGLLSALALAGYAVAGQVWQLALLAFVWGVGIEAFQVIWDTSVQELVRPERSAGCRRWTTSARWRCCRCRSPWSAPWPTTPARGRCSPWPGWARPP